MASPNPVPETPRVISPTPSISDVSETPDGYYAPVTRSAARRQRQPEDSAETSGSARASRSPLDTLGPAQPPIKPHDTRLAAALSKRSPSPLGLIPLHARYRSFIHRHEIPRKLLHVSIGFLTLSLYSRGVQSLQITPVLFTALVPIAATDLIRHRFEKVNKVYIRCMGALMRETEVTGYNGVIWYLLGAYISLRFFPKDVGVMSVLLLSWCDTAASTFGRLYGRYTTRLRPGKSLAGTMAAWLMGVVTAAAFWGWFVPYIGTFPTDPENSFMFTGRLNLLPNCVRGLLGWEPSTSAVITGPLALGVMSVVSGVVAAGSEFIDMWGWDDNLTIPVLSGVGLWGFLKVFG
ncbi:Phosphatidate cytidylyltransferase [Penicillium cf. griseofulvum]|nr:Phosphatidate cytidylyltransferase [Penicillium cf. griseofulvum]